MAKICRDCQYYREQGMMDSDIPGEGNWCSNSQSLNYRTRPTEKDTCNGFYLRGRKQKGPLKMRLAVKAAQKAAKISSKSRKRHKSRKK